jgi:hypothetical protein
LQLRAQFFRQTQGGRRQFGQSGALLAMRHDLAGLLLAGAEARRAPGRADGIGDGGAVMDAEEAHVPVEIGEHARFTAPQMRAAGDIQHQAIDAVSRHQRREARRPIGKALEIRRIGIRVERDDDDMRRPGTRIGDRHAALQPERPGGRVQRLDLQAIADLRRQDERPLSRSGGGRLLPALLLTPPILIGRPMWQPQGQETP